MGHSEFAIGCPFVESSRKATLATADSGLLRKSGSWADLAALVILKNLLVVIFTNQRRYQIDRVLIAIEVV